MTSHEARQDEGAPPPAHHFATLQQQHGAANLGMWLFLLTEVMFFGGLFAAYAVYRALYPELFQAASHELHVELGTTNTAILIGSSFTMALAVHAGQTGSRRSQAMFLAGTIALGLLFLGVKGFEYYLEAQAGKVPGSGFHWTGPDPEKAQLFFLLYFFMTGLHATHMLVGIAILAILTVLSWRGRFRGGYYSPLETAGLYWHFVDVIWIFLFPLLYLAGAR